MSLYTSDLKNSQIIRDEKLRWMGFCLDHKIWSASTVISHSIPKTWTQVSFVESNKKLIPETQGIYFFITSPKGKFLTHEKHCYILYIGQADNLRKRFTNYFNYAKTQEPSDQLKRRMVLVWKDYLQFHFFETKKLTNKKLTSLEFDLIDSIIPPYNIRFRAKAIKNKVKLYAPR